MPEPPPSTTRLGDWYATILSVRPAHLVLLVNEPTRLAVVLPARELSTLAKRIPDAVAEVLRELGASDEVIEKERGAMAELAFAKTASRSVVGTMNEFSFHLELRVEAHEGMDLLELAKFLNRTPVSPLDYNRPDDAVKQVLGIALTPGRSHAPKEQGNPPRKNAAAIYELKVTLRGITPAVWRRLRARSNITLFKLHSSLQTAVGWTDSHLHEFVAQGRSYGGVDPEFPRRQDERKRVLGDVLRAPGDHLVYVYDFGDGWEHDVVLEQVLDSDPGGKYPYVRGGERACPPEDCGGVAGYAHLLDVLASPGHREHRDLAEWVGGSFDPEAIDINEINRALHGGWYLPKTADAPRSKTALPRMRLLQLGSKKRRRYTRRGQ